MKLMVIGGGGREHAIIKKLKENPAVEEIYCLPGNGGIAADAVCVPEIGAKDIPAQVKFAKAHRIDYAVVAPDDPLALGAVDALTEAGIPCFGPDKKAAVIEASKAFSKDLMKKYGIPTAKYELFTDADAACAYIDAQGAPIVVKADGLALGKGVVVAQTVEEAKAAVRSMIEDKAFGQSGARVVIEEFMEGPEVSVLSFTDGETVVPMVSSMDHKCALDGDKGPNTGGMGTIAPNPCYTEKIADECKQTIFLPTIRAMKAEGRPFKGCLYFGLMLTKDGPKVVEYNCRFGDPETQVVLPLLKSHGHAGHDERHAQGCRRRVFGRFRLLRRPRLERVPQEVRERLPHHDERRGRCAHLRRGREERRRQAPDRGRPRARRYRRRPHARGGREGGLPFIVRGRFCQQILPQRHWPPSPRRAKGERVNGLSRLC